MQNSKRQWQNRKQIKQSVRAKLRGRTIVAFIACIIPQILPWAMRLIPVEFGIVYFSIADVAFGLSLPMMLLSIVAATFVTNPISAQVAGYFIKLNRDPENLPSPISVCDCFGPGYWRLVKGMFLRDICVSVVPLVLIAAGLLLLPGEDGEGLLTIFEKIRARNVSPVMLLIVAAVGLYLGIRYAMVPYVLSDKPEISASKALAQSAQLMRGRILEQAILALSFFWWMLLPSVTFLIGAIYTYPYLEGTMAAYYLAYSKPSPGSDEEAYAA